MHRLVVLLGLLVTACAPAPKRPEVAPRPPIAIAHLPRDTALWLATENLSQLVVALDKRVIERGLRARYEALAYQLVSETGRNLLDLGELSAIGVDVHGPAGMAWLLGPDRAVVAFVSLRDTARFKNELYRLASGVATRARPVRPEVVGELVMAAEGEVGVLVDEGLAMIVLADDAWSVANRLAKLDARETLAHDDHFRAAKISREGTLFGYADVRALLYHQAGMDPRWRGTTRALVLRDIERAHREALRIARERGAEVGELVMIDQDFRQEQAALRDDDKTRRLRALVGSVEGTAFRVDVEPSSVRMHLDIDLADHAALRGGLSVLGDRPIGGMKLGNMAGGIAVGDLWLRAMTHERETQKPEPLPEGLEQATAEYRKKRQQLAALDVQIARHRDRQESERRARAQRLALALGRVQIEDKPTRAGLAVDVAYATRGTTFARLLVDLVRFDDTTDDAVLQTLLEKRRALDDDLYELEQRPKP